MSSDLLDILFADRNKLYGAYPLRKEYNNRLTTALFITGAFVAIALFVYYSTGNPKVYISRIITIPPEPPITPESRKPFEPKPPAQPLKAAQAATKQNTTYVVVPDQKVKHSLPPVEELANVRIGLKDQAGPIDSNFPPPPPSGNNGVGITPSSPAENENSILETVDIESVYPGGLKAWKRFLIKTFRYPAEAEANLIKGTVLIRFVVDKEGNVSEITALSGPEELRAEAIRVIGKSGKWSPAIHKNKQVNSYKYQQIIFQLEE